MTDNHKSKDKRKMCTSVNRKHKVRCMLLKGHIIAHLFEVRW